MAAVLAFVGLEVALFETGASQPILRLVHQVPWVAVLGVFMIVGWLASRAAWRAQGTVVPYVALVGFVVAEAVIFVPLIDAAERTVPGTTRSAVVITVLGFVGLTLVAVWSRRQFTTLAMVVRWGMVLALVAIVAGWLFGFGLGLWFSVAMVGLAGGAVLTDTAKVLHRYPRHRHVAAALELFSSTAMMLWYVLRIVRRAQR